MCETKTIKKHKDARILFSFVNILLVNTIYVYLQSFTLNETRKIVRLIDGCIPYKWPVYSLMVVLLLKLHSLAYKISDPFLWMILKWKIHQILEITIKETFCIEMETIWTAALWANILMWTTQKEICNHALECFIVNDGAIIVDAFETQRKFRHYHVLDEFSFVMRFVFHLNWNAFSSGLDLISAQNGSNWLRHYSHKILSVYAILHFSRQKERDR